MLQPCTGRLWRFQEGLALLSKANGGLSTKKILEDAHGLPRGLTPALSERLLSMLAREAVAISGTFAGPLSDQ